MMTTDFWIGILVGILIGFIAIMIVGLTAAKVMFPKLTSRLFEDWVKDVDLK